MATNSRTSRRLTHCQTTPTQRRLERFCGLVFGLWLGMYLIDTAMHPKPSNLTRAPYALSLHP